MPKSPINDQEPWEAKQYIRIFHSALEAYEKDHPDWRFEVLFSLIKRGLIGLKQQIEDPERTQVTWENPFTQFHYPVDWDWSGKDIISSQLVTGTFTKENTCDQKTAQKTLNENLVRHLNVLALQDFTRHVWLEKHGDTFGVILPGNLGEELRAIKNERQRQEFLEEISHPFSIGAALVDFTPEAAKEGKRIPKRLAKQLAKIERLIAIERLSFSCDIGGRKLDFSLVFQIHPLTIDHEQRKAYHSITVGLFMPPKLVADDLIEATPADWRRDDIEILWRKLLQEIDKIITDFIPEVESKSSVILLVNATFKIPLASANQDNLDATRKITLDALQKMGGLDEFNMKVIKPQEEETHRGVASPNLVRQKTNTSANNPWLSGSFYLLTVVVLMVSLATIAKLLDLFVLPLVIVGGLLFVIIIGALQLRNDDKIEERNFLSLMKLALQKLPLVRKLFVGKNRNKT